jgi:hypothetical protein
VIEDILDELIDLPRRRAEIDAREVVLIDTALEAGETLASLAPLYGFTPQAMSERYRKIGGTRPLRPGRPRKRRSPRRDGGGSLAGVQTHVRDPKSQPPGEPTPKPRNPGTDAGVSIGSATTEKI